MDSSTSSHLNGTHLNRDSNNASYGSFLNGISQFADNADTQPANEDFADQFFDPALFESTSNSYPQGFSQSSTSFQPTYDHNVGRQSASPAASSYSTQQPQYPHQYTPSIYDSRNVTQGQQSFDPRFMQQRPTPSPVHLDNYQYQPQMNYQNQMYNTQQVNLQQRQSATPVPTYPPRQQMPPYMGFPGQQSQLPQQYPSYHDPSRQSTHSFIDPLMLNSGQLHQANGAHPGYPSQPQYAQQPYYTKGGFTIDPRSLQASQAAQTTPTGAQPQQQQLLQPQPSQQGMSGVFKPDPPSKPKVPKDPHVPKKSKTKLALDGTTIRSGASENGSDSDDLSIQNEEPPELPPAVLSVSVPTDERGKAMYLAVQAVWSPRNKTASPEKIRNGVAAFGETIRTMRDLWKTRSDSLKAAELPNAKNAGDIPKLKEDVAHYRQVMEIIVTRSLQYAHPSILKRLGENHFTMSALHSFLLDRFNASDFNSQLIQSILKFAVNFNTIDEEQLERTKWAKILPRFAKKSTNDIRKLAQEILDNATALTAKKKADGKAESTGSPNAISDTTSIASKDSIAGVKRSREGDITAPPVAKKTLVKPSSKPLALQNEERRRAREAAQAANKSDKVAPAASSAAPAKAKVAVAAPPKSALFTSLMSASKKPGTSIADRAAAAAAAVKDKPTAGASTSPAAVVQPKKEPGRRESPPRPTGLSTGAKGSSSFLGLLAGMDKKEETKPQQEDVIPNESEEQKRVRLRKEARRKLRVSWKPDSDLVETRLFTHDPEEETGQTDSMMRDAGDTVKEGEMLKLHKGMEDLDDDEDEEDEVEDNYAMPSEVDFSDIQGELVDNTTRFGGPVTPESASKAAQDKLEENTLMAIYDSQADRPITPKEPPDDADDADIDFQPCADFGDPGTTIRDREKEFLSRRVSLATMNFGMDGANGMATNGMTTSQASSQPQPAMASTDLQRTLGLLGQQPAAASQAPVAAGMDLHKLIATVQQFQQMQFQPPPPATTALPVNNNLSALLAQMQQQQPPPPQPPQPVQALPLGIGGNPNPYPGSEDVSRKHGRAESDYGRESGNKKQKSGPKTGDALPYNYKTQPCSFYKQNKCLKGDACTYRHDDD